MAGETMANTASNKKDYSWIGSVSSLLAVLTCYGTLSTVALLSVIGISVEIDEGLLVKLFTGFLVVALTGMGYSFRTHRHPGPLLLSIASAALLLWVFYGSYSKPMEMTGFIALVIASLWDFRAKKRACINTCSD